MPPIELPIRQARRSMPSPRTSSYEALATSSRVKSGKVNLYTLPVTGSTEAGPVEPLQLPSVFAQITNQRLVSIGLPGPSISSHQPGDGSLAFDAACALGDSPVRMKTALSRAALSVPQVSYARRAPVSAPPRFIANGEGRSKYWRASVTASSSIS